MIQAMLHAAMLVGSIVFISSGVILNGLALSALIEGGWRGVYPWRFYSAVTGGIILVWFGVAIVLYLHDVVK